MEVLIGKIFYLALSFMINNYTTTLKKIILQIGCNYVITYVNKS